MVPVSIIIPTLNEAAILQSTLQRLQPWRDAGHEVVLVDGGSVDGSVAIAVPLADRVLRSEAGRARQMNAGAEAARGEVLLFLHADTRLPDSAETMMRQALVARPWGRFDVTLSGRHWLLRVVERMMNWRSCLSGIATGDQAIFVERDLFEAVGGYPEQPLMEDIALSRRLKRRVGPPACLRPPLITSSRRWEENGILRTIWLMWRLRLAYFLGVSPQRLAQQYRDQRAADSAGSRD
jgi:rSAM/selenodomain-associated transferase 2